MEVVIGYNEKNGPVVYATAWACLHRRYAQGWYGDYVDQVEVRRLALEEDEHRRERRALIFLNRRNDREYEGIDLAEVVE